ncbi:MAG: hypothetical protein IJ681_04105 [Bacteroidales bacterium]|nr:hypothetical protein [Bacteroidales bacterium]
MGRYSYTLHTSYNYAEAFGKCFYYRYEWENNIADCCQDIFYSVSKTESHSINWE